MQAAAHEVIRPSQPTPAERAAGFPPEFLRAGVLRLRFLASAVLVVTMMLVGLVIALPAIGVEPKWIHIAFSVDRSLSALLAAGIATSALAMIAATYRSTLRPERVLAIGVGFQVLIALFICAGDFVLPWTAHEPTHGIPAATLWVMAFPLVPSTVRRNAVAALAAAAMGPATLLAAAALGRNVPDAQPAFAFYLPLFVAALVSIFATAIMYRLAVDVSRARRLGSYELVDLVATGGMGEIWRARHGSLIRPAAIKLLRPKSLEGCSDADLARIHRKFAREAQSTALLTSPHTVALYDFGRTDDGTIYYVMELLGGLDLDALVRSDGPQPAERVVHVLCQICHSLSEAHALGLVHRDIKPANVRLTVYGGEYDFVKVLDFGLVKPHLVADDPMRTIDGYVAGTPAYIAPEQATGSTIDGRVDLYALGCVAYYLLTGRTVFEAETSMEMMFAHVKEPPVPPSLRTTQPIPPALEKLMLELLAKNPAERPPTSAAVAWRLHEIALASAWTAERAEEWWRIRYPEEIMRNLTESGWAAAEAEGIASPGWPERGHGTRKRKVTGPTEAVTGAMIPPVPPSRSGRDDATARLRTTARH